MMTKPNCPIIAIEEHYWDPELTKHFTGGEAPRGGDADKRLYDLGNLRLKEMDDAGIDIQVLSHGAPSTQKLPIDIAASNSVTSDRVANAKIRYAGNGAVADANAMGWLARFFNSVLFPF